MESINQTPYGWHGSQYVCHAAEVRTGGFCLCLLGYNPDFWVVLALLSAVDMGKQRPCFPSPFERRATKFFSRNLHH